MKRKLLSFIMLFAVTICFIGGCKKDDDTNEQEILVDNGKEIIAKIGENVYSADQVYGDLVDLSSNAEYIYEELEDLLIKNAVLVTDSMRSRIVNEVEKWKKDIKDNATMNGTSYKEALNAALVSEGVSSEEELIEKKIFALQEEIITNQYWNNNKERYYNQYFNDGYVYHISQIVVNVSKSDYQDEFGLSFTDSAEKLYKIIDALIKGESFYNVAIQYSDDSNTRDNGGDMGMVTLNDTSLSNEVKYALASYSIYQENAQLSHPEYMDEVYLNGIEAIPQKYIDLLGEIYNDTSIKYISSGLDSSRVYGRNIIGNNLFNTRTYRVLQSDGDVDVKEYSNIRMPLTEVAGFDIKSTQNIIVNDEGHPILVVRSDTGIHFISIKKSAFAGEDELKKYYSTEIDELDGYTTYLESVVAAKGESVKAETIEKLENLAREYAIMKVSGNSDFAGNENFIRYDMFNEYLNKTYNGVKFEIVDEQIKEIIEKYINTQKEYIQAKINLKFDEGYEKNANYAKSENSQIKTKEIPILSCLEQDTDKKYKCKYSRESGFEVYTASVGGAD